MGAVQCSCGKSIKVPENAAGRKVKCPVCARVSVVPGGSAAPPKAATSACGACGQVVRIPPLSTRKVVSCPKCGGLVKIEGAAAPVPAEAKEPPRPRGRKVAEAAATASTAEERAVTDFAGFVAALGAAVLAVAIVLPMGGLGRASIYLWDVFSAIGQLPTSFTILIFYPVIGAIAGFVAWKSDHTLTRLILLGCVGVLPIFVFGMFLLPYFEEAAQAAGKMMCQQRLMNLYRGLLMYEMKNNRLPAHLGQLYPEFIGNPSEFLCPACTDEAPSKLPAALAGDDMKFASYGYDPKALRPGVNIPVVYDNRGNHGAKRYAVYTQGDGGEMREAPGLETGRAGRERPLGFSGVFWALSLAGVLLMLATSTAGGAAAAGLRLSGGWKGAIAGMAAAAGGLSLWARMVVPGGVTLGMWVIQIVILCVCAVTIAATLVPSEGGRGLGIAAFMGLLLLVVMGLYMLFSFGGKDGSSIVSVNVAIRALGPFLLIYGAGFALYGLKFEAGHQPQSAK